jgi:Tol biopolymer transport system component
MFLNFSFIQQAKAQFYTGSQMDFGKNRIQHTEHDWYFYRYPRYDTYFYVGGKDLANYTARIADQFLVKLEERFDYTLENRINFLIFNRLSDLKQSNVGLESGGKFNLGGVTQLVGNKVLLNYESTLDAFEQQIRRGMAQVMLEEMLFGSDLRDKIRTNMLLSVPEWFTEGLIAYVGSNWNTEIDNYVRDGIVEGRYLKFNRLRDEDAKHVGHAIWNYIATVYGEKVIPSIIEMVRITRNLDNAFSMILGIDVNELTQEWLNYYDKRYYYQDTLYNTPLGKSIYKRNKNPIQLLQPRLSPSGAYLAFVRNDKGKAKVFIYNTKTGKRKKVFKTGFKLQNITDYSYPLLEWHPNGEILSILYEHKSRIRLQFYNILKDEHDFKFINNLTKVVDMAYAPDGKKLVFSAMHGGQSDIYVFNNISNTLEQITNDLFDDRYPRFFNQGSSIIFSSNRQSDSLKPVLPFATPDFQRGLDLFIYDYAQKDDVLFRVTNTYGINEKMPRDAGNKKFYYLSDENGIYNRYSGYVDSAIAFIDTAEHYRYFTISKPLTNYNRSILDYSLDNTGTQTSEITYVNTRNWLRFNQDPSIEIGELNKLPPTVYAAQFRTVVKKEPTQPKQPPTQSGAGKVRKIVVFGNDKSKEEKERIDINNYRFEGESEKPKKESSQSDTSAQKVQKSQEDSGFKIGRQRFYETAYYSDYLVTQLDRSFLNFGYQPFTGSTGYLNPSLNGMFRVGIADLFEDRKIFGAVRLAGILTGNEYLLGYQNFKKRLDKSIMFHRQGLQGQGLGTQRIMVHHLIYNLSYPFNEVMRVEGTATYRNERNVFIATDLQNLQRQSFTNHWGVVKGEFIYDNSFELGLNLFSGIRFKAFAEFYKQVNAQKTNVTILGVDFRHYLPLHKNIILASRFAGSTSFGPRKLMYYLGGVDNWLNPRFDNATNIDFDQNYIFQTIATNMRGFFQNTRNGNSFSVINNEIRIPLFQYLIKKPLRSDFLKNFQIVPFNDIGVAFTGSSPYSKDNTFNQQIITSGPITVILENQREPIIYSYGLGVRARILGYFVRVDYARGVEDGIRLPAIYHLSFSLDF